MRPTITVEGRRVYIRARYGDPCLRELHRLGAHWEPQTERWWLSVAKKEEVEAIIDKSTNKPNETADEIIVIGRATYKGRNYYVRWVGEMRSGAFRAHLCSLDGDDFWVTATRPHEFTITDEIARITKTYKKARSLRSIQQFIERTKTM